MDVNDLKRRARTFEQGADAYERLRPQFPRAMFDMLPNRVGKRLGGRVLEVGAGTGRVTIELLRTGARVEVAEPSADMVRVLTERLGELGLAGRAHLRQMSFEEVPDDSRYDLVVAAQSFHWADPATRWQRLAAMLRPDGRAFMCWNGWRIDPAAHDHDAVRAAYAANGAGLESDLADARSNGSWAEAEVGAADGLRLVATDTYAWDWSLPAEDYLALLATTSQYAVIEADRLERLFGGLRTVLGPQVRLAGRTVAITISTA